MRVSVRARLRVRMWERLTNVNFIHNCLSINTKLCAHYRSFYFRPSHLDIFGRLNNRLFLSPICENESLCSWACTVINVQWWKQNNKKVLPFNAQKSVFKEICADRPFNCVLIFLCMCVHSTLIICLSNKRHSFYDIHLIAIFTQWGLISGPPSARISFQWHAHAHVHAHSHTGKQVCERALTLRCKIKSARNHCTILVSKIATITIKTAQIVRAMSDSHSTKENARASEGDKITIKQKWRRALRY